MAADTRHVHRLDLDELRRELTTLEAAEVKISGERRRLHDQIDYGFAGEATLAREREVSAERRRLHERIDSLRELLRAESGVAVEDPDLKRPRLGEWQGISPEPVAVDDSLAGQPEL